MNVLVIPDVHLKPYMFDRATELLNEGIAQNAVCLMDIPDNWGQFFNLDLYKKTYDRAIRFAKDFPSALWCYGNHDLSYEWGRLETGYSPYAEAIAVTKLHRLRSELPSPDSIAFIHRIDNVLFLHGGLTQSFVKTHIEPEKYDDTDYVIGAVNKLSADELWDDGSPLWFRPQNYIKAMYKEDELIQVVGHTPVKEITKTGCVISCDVFSEYKDGTPIGIKKYPVIDTVTGDFKITD